MPIYFIFQASGYGTYTWGDTQVYANGGFDMLNTGATHFFDQNGYESLPNIIAGASDTANFKDVPGLPINQPGGTIAFAYWVLSLVLTWNGVLLIGGTDTVFTKPTVSLPPPQ